MAVTPPRKMLSQIKVREIMRQTPVSVTAGATIDQAIRCTIKYKINAVLVTDKLLEPHGVVSKSDLMSAYYAGIPIHRPVWLIMSTPPLMCLADDTLDFALNLMREKAVHRIYVQDDRGIGVLSYPDIVGLLYRYCSQCDRNLQPGRRTDGPHPGAALVKDVMTHRVLSLSAGESLMRVMEELSAYRFGALLMTGWGGVPLGVISKTDLMLAYRHGVPNTEKAATVMRTPVRNFSQEGPLSNAIQEMIFSDIQRLFVYRGEPENIVGVLSLGDAAQARSGSCRACMSCRTELP